jgi:hypothetical protein
MIAVMAFAHGHGCYGGPLLGSSCNGEEWPTGQGHPQRSSKKAVLVGSIWNHCDADHPTFVSPAALGVLAVHLVWQLRNCTRAELKAHVWQYVAYMAVCGSMWQYVAVCGHTQDVLQPIMIMLAILQVLSSVSPEQV